MASTVQNGDLTMTTTDDRVSLITSTKHGSIELVYADGSGRVVTYPTKREALAMIEQLRRFVNETEFNVSEPDVLADLLPHPKPTHYVIVDSQNGTSLKHQYLTRKNAQTRADKLDAEYGGVRYIVKPIW